MTTVKSGLKALKHLPRVILSISVAFYSVRKLFEYIYGLSKILSDLLSLAVFQFEMCQLHLSASFIYLYYGCTAIIIF